MFFIERGVSGLGGSVLRCRMVRGVGDVYYEVIVCLFVFSKYSTGGRKGFCSFLGWMVCIFVSGVGE